MQKTDNITATAANDQQNKAHWKIPEENGYKTDSETESTFDRDTKSRKLPKVKGLERRKQKRDTLNIVVDRLICEIDQLDLDCDKEVIHRKGSNFESDQGDLGCPSPLLKKKRSVQTRECGLTSTSEEEPQRLGAMLRMKDRRQQKQGGAFSSAVEFTTSATDADKLTTTDDDKLKKMTPQIHFNKKLFKGLAATLEEEHETASDSGEGMDKQTDHRYHHLAIIASSGDETNPVIKNQQPEQLRHKLIGQHRKTSFSSVISAPKTNLKVRANKVNNSFKNEQQAMMTPQSLIVMNHFNVIDEDESEIENTPEQPATELQDSLIDIKPIQNKIEEQATEAVEVKPTETKDNPVKGIAFFILSTVFMVLTNTLSKQQFIMTPTLSVFDALFARGLVSLVLLALYMNRNIKAELIDSVDSSNLKALVFRCGSGAVCQVIAFQSIKYFDVSTVGMVCSLAPIFVCVMAYFLLGERMNYPDVLFLFSVFCCVTLVLLGAGSGSSIDTPEVAVTGGAMALVGLIATPMLTAGQTIASRQMRKMSECVVSTYVQLTITLVIASMMLIQNSSFSFLAEFSMGAWLLLIASAVVNILGSMTKFIAIKNHKTSDLQKLAFLPNVWQFVIDICFMKAVFSGVELTGFVCLFVFYSIYLVWFARANFCQKEEDSDFVSIDDIEAGHKSTETESTQSINDDDHYRFEK